jgi:hypothetical protein
MLTIGSETRSPRSTPRPSSAPPRSSSTTDKSYAGKWKIYFFWPRLGAPPCEHAVSASARANELLVTARSEPDPFNSSFPSNSK